MTTWDIEYTDEFGEWWAGLSDAERISITASVDLLERFGPHLRYPHTSGIKGSRHPHMRELRIQHAFQFIPYTNAVLTLVVARSY